MGTVTKFLKLIKDDKTDVYDIDKINDNLDKIDIDEKDGNYIITISKNSDFLQEAMKKQLENKENSLAQYNQLSKNIKEYNYQIKEMVL